jgi:uncharacterized protein
VPLTRRSLFVLGAVGMATAACGSSLAGTRLRVATGGTGGVYYALGKRLATQWSHELGVSTSVLVTNGSVDNIDKLRDNSADLAFVAADAAAEAGAGMDALARIYDDYIQVLVRDESPIRHLSDLHGRRVSTGSKNSGVTVVAEKLLSLAGLPTLENPMYQQLNLTDSLDALRKAQIDALFWSGGLPTPAITTALEEGPKLRLLDLSDLPITQSVPYYNMETVPRTAYPALNASGPVSTLAVHNLLLVRPDMPDNEAEALVRVLFDAQQRLASDPDQVVAIAAQLIYVRSAIETYPMQLHRGALDYYQSVKI